MLKGPIQIKDRLWFYCLICILLGIFSVKSLANELRSSVSPEFINGLQTTYLKYIAKRLEVKLAILPMPLARRLKAIRAGDIDIMVGAKRTYQPNGDFVYLQPSYESLGSSYYIAKHNIDRLNVKSDLSKLIVGMTIDDRYHQKLAKEDGIEFVLVSSLRQKINMLKLGRIDTFIHFTSSADLKIKQLHLEEELIHARFQPSKREYFVLLSTVSRFMERKIEIESIIANGVESGDFAEMRKTHYANKDTDK